MKILVISHNVFSMTSSMGKTLINFFGEISPENIAQLYFHKQIPTTNICSTYYRITDFDVVKKKKTKIGDVFNINNTISNPDNEKNDSVHEEQIYKLGKKKKSYMYIGRNLIWSTKKWHNEKLFNWIDKFNPDIIFFASGDYIFSYKVAMSIADYKNIPIVTYVCDDYYFVNRKSISPLYHINRIQYKATLKQLFAKHKNVIAICDKITTDYGKEFNINCKTIMTSSSLNAFAQKNNDETVVISYLGNMGYNRHLQLVEIGKALKEISDGKLFIDVYSGETRSEITDVLNEKNGIRFHGSVSYDKVIEIMKNSDILIHTEAFDKTTRDKVRYSVSTKIADTLSCGRCLFAYGPSDVASIEYLIDNNCACVATSESELENKLKDIIFNPSSRNTYINKALKLADKNHNIIRNGKLFKQIIEKVAGQSNEGNAD